jgi:hypothetical protein
MAHSTGSFGQHQNVPRRRWVHQDWLLATGYWRVTEPSAPGTTDLRRILAHLAEDGSEAARFAGLLLRDRGTVHRIDAPAERDVWDLEIQRGDCLVIFRAEGALTLQPHVVHSTDSAQGPAGPCPVGLAVFTWARAHGVPFRLDDPEDFDHDLLAHGREALDWIGQAEGGDRLDRVHSTWLAYRNAPARLEATPLWTLLARTVDAMNAAAMNAAVINAAAPNEAAEPSPSDRVNDAGTGASG